MVAWLYKLSIISLFNRLSDNKIFHIELPDIWPLKGISLLWMFTESVIYETNL